MANKTQLRLGQQTGSLGDFKGGIIDSRPESGAASLPLIPLNSGSMVGIMSEVVSSIKRINGGGTFAGQAAGEFNHANTQFKNFTNAETKVTIGNSANEQDATLKFAGHSGGTDMYVALDDGTDKLLIGQGNTVGSNLNITINSADRDVIFGGDIEVTGGKVTLSNGSIIDSEAAGILELTEDVVKTSAALRVGSNVIQASDGGSTITLDTSDNVTIGNDITIGGNVIRASDGGATITMDTSDNVTIGGDLTVGGGDIIGPVDGSLTIKADTDLIFKVDSDNDGTETFQFQNGAGAEVALLNEAGDLSISGDLTVSGNDIKSNGGTTAITLSGANVTVPGNLTVNGTQFKIDGETVVMDDTLMEMGTVDKAAPTSATTKDLGLLLHRHNGSAASLNFIGFDEANDKFKMFVGVTDDGDGTVSGGSPGTLEVDVEGSSTLSVVTDSSANTAFPVVFHDESNALLDSQFIEINPSSKKLQFTGGDAQDIASLAIDANAALTILTNDAAGTAASIILDADGDIELDAASDILFRKAGTQYLKIQDTGNQSPALIPEVGKSLAFGITGGNDGVGFVNAVTGLTLGHFTGSAQGIDLVLSGGQGDIIVKTNRGGSSEEVARFDASAGSFHMADNRPLEFGDAGESILGDGTRLLINSSEDIRLDAAADISLDSDSFAFRYKDGGTERLVLLKDGSDHIKLQSEISDKDIIIAVNDGGSPGSTVATFTGDTRHLVLNSSNATGVTPGLLAFASDLQEAVYGDGSNLYLRSGNTGFKIPSSDGSNGHVLSTDGAGNLSFVAQGGAANSSKKVGTIAAANGLAANAALAFSTNATFTETTSALDVSAVAAANRLAAVDVYVNGQLLMSGTSAPGVNVAGGDYVLVDVDSASASDADLKFAFDLEQDDVVSVIVRA